MVRLSTFLVLANGATSKPAGIFPDDTSRRESVRFGRRFTGTSCELERNVDSFTVLVMEDLRDVPLPRVPVDAATREAAIFSFIALLAGFASFLIAFRDSSRGLSNSFLVTMVFSIKSQGAPALNGTKSGKRY